jgi:protein-S-isoprenylcysteine O-methyltransferase Ste14
MGKSKNNDNPKVKLAPPIVFLGLGLIGVGMEYVVPLSIGIDSPANYLGVGVIIASIVGLGIMAKLFKRHETAVEPWETTSKIITKGPYKYSRNPIYIFACGVPIGLGIAFNSYWALFAFIPALIIVYYTAVKKEERYLETKFGQEYLAYKAKVSMN